MRHWLEGLRWAGWLLAPLPVIAVLAVLWAVRADKTLEMQTASQAWDTAVERIRACRRAGPRPMIDWRSCEEEVLADDWSRERQPDHRR